MKLIHIFIVYIIISPILEFLGGYAFSKSKNPIIHRAAIREWAMSGLFVKYIPNKCKLNCNKTCGNWNCAKFHKK